MVDLEFRFVIRHTAEYLDAAYDRFNVLGTREIYCAYYSVIDAQGSGISAIKTLEILWKFAIMIR